MAPQFLPANRCIYCGSTSDLSDEHIVPYGLNGDLVLPRASCRTCAQTTSEIELRVLRGELWATRLMRGMKSRRAHRMAPADFPIEFERNGVWKREVLELKDYPVLLHFPRFAPPRILADPALHKPGIDVAGVDTISFGRRPEEVLATVGAKAMRSTASQRPALFARMLAKIAYAMSAASGELARLSEPSPLPAVILGQDQDIGRWVGTLSSANPIHRENLHRVSIGDYPERRVLIGEVQLFCDSAAPIYAVVIGSLKG